MEWWTPKQAGLYLQRGSRFVRNEIKAGRMRGAIVGGRREILTCQDWCDQWVTARATPVEITLQTRVVRWPPRSKRREQT